MFFRRSAALAAAVLLAQAPAAWAAISEGEITWWDTTGTQWPATLPLENGAQAVAVDDNCGGTIGVKLYKTAAGAAFTRWLSYTSASPPVAPFSDRPEGFSPDPYMPGMFGTSGLHFNPDTPMSSIRCWTDYVFNDQLIEFALELDFSSARCTSGSTGKSTIIAISDIYRKFPNNLPNPTITITATKVGGGAGSVADWALYNSDKGPVLDAGQAGPNRILTWEPAGDNLSVVTRGSETTEAPGTGAGNTADSVLGLIALSETEKYSKIRLVYNSFAYGYDLMGFSVGTVRSAATCGAVATTRPHSKVAPGKVLSYTATFDSRKTAAKAPVSDLVFTLPLPAGVTAKSYALSPKVGTIPTVVDGSLVWNLGKVKAGGKFKVSLKLVASACTTPDPLDLTGEFAFTTLAGSSRVNACLNRPLYVWNNGCPAIPKGVLGAKSDFTCTCTSCGCNGRKCSCDQSTCQCASNTL